MLYFDKLYRDKGTRRLAHFITPRILDTNTFEFPINSALYWFKVNPIVEYISREYSYLKNTNKVVVESIFNYSDKANNGKYTESTTSINNIISDMYKKEKTFKFLKPNMLNVKVTDKVLFVYNYGALTNRYRYISHPMNRIFRYNNSLLTLTEDISKSTRNKFILLDIPNELPTRLDLNKYSVKVLTNQLDNIPTYKHFTIIELWKLLTPELRVNSMFNNIHQEDYNSTNLMFVIDNKCVILNLGILLGIVSEYNLPSDLEKHKASTVRKLLYILIYKLINENVVNNSDLEQLDSKTINIADNINEDKDDTIDVDIIMEQQVVESAIIKSSSEDDIDPDNTEIVEEDTSSVIEAKIVLNETNDNTNYTSISDIKADSGNFKTVLSKVESLRTNNVISKKEYETISETINSQDKLVSPYDTKDKLIDVLNIDNDNYVIPRDKMTITPNKVVLNPKQNIDVIGTIDKDYITKQYKKDIIRAVYGIQNHNMIVNGYDIKTSNSILGTMEEHSINIKSLSGGTSTVKIMLPKIENDGTFKLSQNTYRLRKFRGDLPIRKINNTEVALSSYYGKIFISKATYKKDDVGYWLRNQIVKLYETDNKLRDLVLTPPTILDVKIPQLYGHISRYIKSFRYDKLFLTFDYENRYKHFKDIDIKILTTIEKDGNILVGNISNIPVVMDVSSRLFMYEKGKFKELPELLLYLNIDISKMPIEYTNIQIYKTTIPTVILLTYYIGINTLLKVLNIKYSIFESNSRITLLPNQFKLVFKNVTLVIDRDYGYSDLILAGLRSIVDITKSVDLDTFNTRSNFSIIFNKLGLNLLTINEIKLLENMFVDPMTLTVLKTMKEATNFKGLLIRANELLVDDSYVNPNNILEMSIKGYERIAGMLYSELVTSIKEHENKSYFSKSKITMNPYTVINKLNEDSSTVLVDDLNPMAALKQAEDVTYLGHNGRSALSMSRDTRAMHESEIGIISEATKDSSDVGISAYMTAAPMISNTRGILDKFNIEEDGISGVLSTNGLLMPFTINDDIKRANFSSIMASHIVPINNMRVPNVRTGYEAILPVRSDKKFIIVAEDEGVVTKLMDTSIEVNYKNLGIKKYSIKNWTSKEESNSCYTHIMVPNLKIGDKFTRDDTIIYDSSFFEPDIFNNKRVIYKQGNIITVALVEDSQTHEDSAAISKNMSSYLGTTITKVKSIVINKSDNILNIKMPNVSIEPSDILFSITDSFIDDEDLDERTIAILQDIKTSSPKSKIRGTISKIEVRYNCELDTISKSLRKLISHSDKELLEQTGYTGRVTSSYSISGVPLLEDTVEIKVYINTGVSMGIGDKAILSNQLKFTVGEVYNYDITTTDKTPVDILFSSRSIAARIVNSPYLIGTTSMLLDKIADKAIDIYFK